MSHGDTDQMVTDGARSPTDPDIDDLLEELDALERIVDDPHEREQVRRTISLVERMPGSKAFTSQISKYTTRDVAESFVGGVLLSLPLLVEDGVFDIAAWFVEVTLSGVPVFLLANVAFVVTMTTGLIYAADFRDVKTSHPILGLVPRRLVGVLTVSLVVAVGMMAMWGRLHEGAPTAMEALARVTVIWTAAAFGAALGDILPGESEAPDIQNQIAEFRDTFGDD